jgi:hypothetical protein
MTSDRQKFVVRMATPPTKRLLASGVYWNEFLRPLGVPLPRMVAPSLEPSEIEFHWMNVLTLNKQLRQVVDAYTVLFCVDFMSELGQRFNKENQPEIDVEKFARLKSVFETLAH